MIARADDRVMNKAVFILRKMSADEKLQEIARIRERALHDEASYIETAKAEGRAKGRAEERENIVQNMRKYGMDEEQIALILSRPN